MQYLHVYVLVITDSNRRRTVLPGHPRLEQALFELFIIVATVSCERDVNVLLH